MSQHYQRSDDNQYPQFDFPSPENQPEDFTPTQGKYTSAEDQQAMRDFMPTQERYVPATDFAPTQGEHSPAENQQSVNGFVPFQDEYPLAGSQQPIVSFVPRQGGYSSLVQRGSAPKKKHSLLGKQQTAGNPVPMQERPTSSGEQQAAGSFAASQEWQSPSGEQQAARSFAPMQERPASSGEQQAAGSFAASQEWQSPLGKRQTSGNAVPLPTSSGEQQAAGSFAPGYERQSLLGRQQATGSTGSMQGGLFLGNQLATGSMRSTQGGQSLLGRQQATGTFMSAQGGQVFTDHRQAVGDFVPGLEGYSSPLGKRQPPPGMAANNVPHFLQKLRAKRSPEQTANGVVEARSFDITVVAIVAASIGGLDLCLFLLSLCGLSVMSAITHPLDATPVAGSLASQLSAVVDLNALMLGTLYYTALGVGHLYIARGLWQLKSWAYWGILIIEGLTICIQLIALIFNHNGGAFFANVYIPLLIAIYLLAAGEIRRTFQIPF